MGVNRRNFLKALGLTAAGVGAMQAVDLLASSAPPAQTDSEPGRQAAGTRWAMVVIASKLTEEDCHAAIEACNYAHNVPTIHVDEKDADKKDDHGAHTGDDKAIDIEEEIKWIWTAEFENVFPDQMGEFLSDEAEHTDFLVMCNHCTDPPCVRVCPTQSTWKRADGIVMMDMHRCIGCRFCMVGCPYGSRSFNWKDPRDYITKLNYSYPTRMKGVVEKCNFCAERIFKGLPPACVEACKGGGLVFGDLNSPDSEVRTLLREHQAMRRKPSLGTGPNVYYII